MRYLGTMLVALVYLAGCNQSETSDPSDLAQAPSLMATDVHLQGRASALLAFHLDESSTDYGSQSQLKGVKATSSNQRTLTSWPDFSPPLLAATQSGPWDFSGSNALWFNLKYTAVNGQTQTYNIVLDQTVTTRDMPEETLASEVYFRISETIGDILEISQGPITFKGPSDMGGRIELVPTIEQNITLTDLGFNTDNRISEGGSSVDGHFYTGTLTIYDTVNHTSTYEPWSIFIEFDTMDIIHNSTLNLPPGSYELTLIVSQGKEQYVGANSLTVEEESEIDLVMNLTPAVGNTDLDIETISVYSQLKVNFSVSQLANMSNPLLGIEINDTEEFVFSISKTEATNHFYLDTLANIHSFEFRLYDGNNLLGKSASILADDAFEDDYNTPIQVYPLITEIDIELDTGTTNISQMNLKIPADIIDTMGDANDIKLKLDVFGITDETQSMEIIDLILEDEHYLASLSFEYQYFQTATVSIQFLNKISGVNLGGCSGSWQLISFDHTFACNAVVVDDDILYTHLNSTLVINTLSIYGNPISGIIIKDQNQQQLGVTGSVNGTDGYLKVNLQPGDYTIEGYLDSESVVTKSFTIVPLEGGWTLVGYHGNQQDWNPVSLVSPSLNQDSTLGILDTLFWQAILPTIEEGLMLIDEFGKVTKVSKTLLNNAACVNPFSEYANGVPDTSSFFMFLTDDPMCDGSNALLSGIYLEASSANGIWLKQGESAPFNPWPYSQNTSSGEHNHLWFYLK